MAGAISALLMFYDISVAPSPSIENTARLIGRMARHSIHRLGYEIPLRRAKPKFDGGVAIYLLEGLPSVGPEMARRLITHFGKPAKVFAASGADLPKLKGVGPKTVDSIQTALHTVRTGLRSTKSAPP